ncbi:MAG: hypothetical protein R3F29_04960 [Planctomycetota bacterium]
MSNRSMPLPVAMTEFADDHPDGAELDSSVEEQSVVKNWVIVVGLRERDVGLG